MTRLAPMTQPAAHARAWLSNVRPLDRDTVSQLIDFAGGNRERVWSTAMAERQLAGAGAIHNILAKRKFAYLAEEVGMGKTYVALGAVALLRCFHPSLRVLYIVPREDIQRKWQNELANFAASHWRQRDLRVRTLEDNPVDRGVICGSLADWAQQVVRDPHRDPFLRMSSFSFGLRDKRNDPNRLIPHYDLVVFDEAHNLKHGRRGTSARNRLLEQVLGTHPEDEHGSSAAAIAC